MYKLIALDMDGTLLNEEKKISKANFDAIQNAREKGVKVVLATGRPLKGIHQYLTQLNLISKEEYAVTYNGSLIQNTSGSIIIDKKPLSHEDNKYLYELSKKLNVNIHALTYDKCITPKFNKYSEYEANMNQIPLEIVDFENIDENVVIIKTMFIDEPEILDRVVPEIPKEVYDRFTVVRSAPFFLEFIDKSSNKGSGIHKLAESLGIKQEEVICVGDAGNDLHMIEYAGLGVAMGNAFEEVKKAADYVTATNDDDGVAEVINKFIL